MFLKHSLILFCFFLTSVLSLAQQPCAFLLSGYVLDEDTAEPLAYANVLLENKGRGVVTDSLGFFQFDQMCVGDYLLQVSHIGCTPQQLVIPLNRDSTVYVLLNHRESLLGQVVVVGSLAAYSAEISNNLNREDIENNSNKNFADLLEILPGVSVLKNGSGLSKPVVNGLYGNRVAILNNGIEQAGQQWGNDHAPEVDAFAAAKLSVISGAESMTYSGSGLGAVVLVESNKISRDTHWNGAVLYNLETNGLGHSLHGRLEKRGRFAAWRLSGSFKYSGDSQAPDYYLTNTGKREGNLALQVEKKWSDRHFSELYLSTFNANIGVLRGAHIGNLTDLSDALEREVPFFTEDHFSYDIAAPRQQVNHHLLKGQSKYFINDHQIVQFIYGGQLNLRKEYDVRRNERSDIPSLNLQQYAHFAESNYQHSFSNNWYLKTGLQFRYVINSNDPETGVLPLIPNYDAMTNSAFVLVQKKQARFSYDWGARYDWKQYKVVTISTTLPRVIERFQHRFHNYASSAGAKYDIGNSLTAKINLGYLLRAPEVNELYSAGLHQGVSGIEEGDRNLQSEESWKGTATLEGQWGVLFFQAQAYHQQFNNYIYLEPQQEFRLTIRGAFPLFQYAQTDASIQGLDAMIRLQPFPQSSWTLKYAYIHGRDLNNDLTLINIPANSLYTDVEYRLNDWSRFFQNSIGLNAKYVFQRQGLLPEQDFVLPPDAYFLMGLNLSTQWQWRNTDWQCTLRVENLLNERYRDYLNRLRYFADETGRNMQLQLKCGF